MKQFSKELGKVSITPKGDWDSSITNEKLDIVYDRRNNQAYIAKQDVPIGVDIDNREYWQPLNVSGYADNNFINLTAENENGTITAYESLEEAVATIFPINRRVGATLSFYNLNSDRLDRQAEFELWQFNSTDLSNWENKDYWNNIYYNWNVFAGWYVDADALKNHVETPNVGQYAYVGSNLNDALLYQCRTNGTWTNTGIKVRNYISVVVSGNITIGENGNWFSNGEDTGIPATPAVDEQLDNIIAKHESLSKTVQCIAVTGGASTATNVTYNNDSSGLNAENAQDAIDEVSSKLIYDVSARNDGAVFESLSALLSSSNLSTLIPTSVRHGGMSIRFIQGSVQSSDNNKYVRYNYLKSSTSDANIANVSNWVGMDEIPTAGSDGSVNSNGILDSLVFFISDLVNSGVLEYQKSPITTIADYYIDNKGKWKSQNGQKTIYRQVHKGDFVRTYHGNNANYSKYALFSSEPQVNDVPFLVIPNTPSTIDYSYAIITEDCYIACSNMGGSEEIAVIKSGDVYTLINTYKDYLYVKNLTTVEPTPISNAFIKMDGNIRNNFSGYTVNSYQVSAEDKFYIKGKTSGSITAIAFYNSNTFIKDNIIKLMYNSGGTIDIDEFIQVPQDATYMAISQANDVPLAQKIVVSTYQRTNTQYSAFFISELKSIYSILFSYEETLLTTSDYRNGYFLHHSIGEIKGGGTFTGYRLAIYPVQEGKKYRLVGKNSGGISVACSYTDDTLATKVSQFLPHPQNSQFDVDSIIEVTGSATILAVCEATAYGGIKVYELSNERTINNIKNLQERVFALENAKVVKKQVVCWGDSLTAGASSKNTTYVAEVKAVLTAKGFSLPNASYNYVQTITALLGTDNYQVVNCGVGGENINTIAAREGALPACIESNVTIPALASEYGSISGLNSAFDLTTNCSPLLQGHGNSVNPCYLEGIKCTLSYNSTDGYRIKRQSDGDRAVTVVKGTPIIMYGSSAYRNSEIAILWCWTNGGYVSNDELVQKLKMMVQHLNTEKYIIVGIHYGNTATLITQENELLKNFGDKFFNWRKYVSSNAMYDFGITPTADDLTDMQDGKIPRSFLTDSVHINSGAYMILGWKLYERMLQLGYIEV